MSGTGDKALGGGSGQPSLQVLNHMQRHCQYGRRGQGCPNPHPPMYFKFLRNGARGSNKLDCTYGHPKVGRIALATGRRDRKIVSTITKLEKIRPVLSKPTQGPTKPTIPFMELNIHPYHSRNHKLALLIPVPPSFITRITLRLLISHRPKQTGTLISGYIASQLVMNNWNNLSNHVVSSSNTNTFKNRLASYWKYHPARYDWEASDYFHPGLANFNN